MTPFVPYPSWTSSTRLTLQGLDARTAGPQLDSMATPLGEDDATEQGSERTLCRAEGRVKAL